MIQYYCINSIRLDHTLPSKSEGWRKAGLKLYHRLDLDIKDKYEIFKYVSQTFCAQKAYIDIELFILVLKALFTVFLTDRPYRIANKVANYDYLYNKLGKCALDYLNRDLQNEFLRWSGFDV